MLVLVEVIMGIILVVGVVGIFFVEIGRIKISKSAIDKMVEREHHLKGDIMNDSEKPKNSISSSENKTKSGWLMSFFSAVFVGLIVLAGQIFVEPIVAKRVKIKVSNLRLFELWNI